jgi:hypothetical protein
VPDRYEFENSCKRLEYIFAPRYRMTFYCKMGHLIHLHNPLPKYTVLDRCKSSLPNNNRRCRYRRRYRFFYSYVLLQWLLQIKLTLLKSGLIALRPCFSLFINLVSNKRFIEKDIVF